MTTQANFHSGNASDLVTLVLLFHLEARFHIFSLTGSPLPKKCPCCTQLEFSISSWSSIAHHTSVFENLPLNNISDSYLKYFGRIVKPSQQKASIVPAGWDCYCSEAYAIPDWYQSFVWDQALGPSQRHVHEDVVLKKWDVSVPVLLSPLLSPGGPDTQAQ